MSSTSGASAVPVPAPITPDIAKPAGKSIFQALFDHPIGFWFIFWGEFAERCSFYGMRAIMVSYMLDRLGMSEGPAGSYYYMFVAGAYLLPLAGGFIADNYLGKYKTIVFFSLPYILGHVILGIENKPCLFTAMGLLAMGSGVIKPNISTLMGLTYDQQRPGNDELRTTAFSLFYMAINIGAALSQLTIPWIRTNYGYQIAFLFPALLMALAFIVFALGKPFYAKEVVSREPATPDERKLKWQILGRIGGLFLLVTFFWAIFDQSSGTWIIFGRTYQDTIMFGHDIDVEQVQATNPILIVLLTPLFATLWAVMRSKGILIRATDKIIAGFVLTSLCMGIMAIPGLTAGPLETVAVPLGDVRSKGEAEKVLDKEMPQFAAAMVGNAANPMLAPAELFAAVGEPLAERTLYVKPENKVTIWWQVLAFFIITIAEILISITGLELAFVAAPKTMKSFVTSLWLCTVFLANALLNAPLAQLYPHMNPGLFFALMSVSLIVVAVVFYFIATRFNRMMAEQEAVAKAAALATADGQAGYASSAVPKDGIIDKSRREGIEEERGN